MNDDSIHTFQVFSAKEPMSIQLPAELKNSPLTFLINNEGADYPITALNKKGKKTVMYKGNKAFVTTVNAKKINIARPLFSTGAGHPILVYEIVRAN